MPRAGSSMGALLFMVASVGCTLDLSEKHHCVDDSHCAAGRSCFQGVCRNNDDLDGGMTDPSRPNLVFVTSGTFSARFQSLEAADDICTAAAQATHLPGQFRAWLSTSAIDARDRLGGARGWIRTDGEPFADTIEDIVQGRLFNPLVLDEHGVEVRGAVVTGTDVDGRLDPGQNCADWTSDAGGKVTAGTTEGTTGVWTFFTTRGCDVPARIYCFGTDSVAVVAPMPPRGKLAFLSDDVFVVGGGLVAADSHCQKEAGAAGLSGAFRALLSTSTSAAVDRIQVNRDRVWMRLDGVALNRSGGDSPFESTGIIAPLNVTSKRRYMDASVFAGAPRPDVSGDSAQTCGDWSNAAASAVIGRANYAPWWFDIGSPQPCNDSNTHIYCFQAD